MLIIHCRFSIFQAVPLCNLHHIYYLGFIGLAQPVDEIDTNGSLKFSLAFLPTTQPLSQPEVISTHSEKSAVIFCVQKCTFHSTVHWRENLFSSVFLAYLLSMSCLGKHITVLSKARYYPWELLFLSFFPQYQYFIHSGTVSGITVTTETPPGNHWQTVFILHSLLYTLHISICLGILFVCFYSNRTSWPLFPISPLFSALLAPPFFPESTLPSSLIKKEQAS